MPHDQNQNGHFDPIHQAHAIEQVLFVLQFDRPLNDVNFAKVREVSEQFQSELPGRNDVQNIKMVIGPTGPAGSTPPTPVTVFRRVGPDGTVENELRVEPTSLTFRTSLYTRWDAVWTRTRKYFDAIIPMYVEHAKISGVGLNFIDKFVWVGAISECRPSLLLRPESNYLCPHVHTAKDLWHSHTGAFLRIDSKTKRLLNINVDYIDENRPNGLRRVVTITTVLTDFMNQPGYASSEVAAGDASEFFAAHMKQLHKFGKEVFGNIINDEMSKRIALIG